MADPEDPKALMAEMERLLARLTAPLTLRAPGRAQPVPSLAPLGVLSGLLQEIDETVMARRLVLRNGSAQVLSLDVCNRRLLDVRTSAEPPGADGGAPTSHMNLTFAGGEDLAALRKLLIAFCAAGDVTVEHLPAEGATALEQTGVSVATLTMAWTAAPQEARVGATLPRFLQGSGPLMRAGVLSDGEALLDAQGEPALAERLSGLLAETPLDQVRPSPDAGATALLLSDATLGLCIGFERTSTVAVAYDAEAEGRLLALWHACLRSEAA